MRSLPTSALARISPTSTQAASIVARCGLGQRYPIPGAEAIAALYRDTAITEMDYDYERNSAWSLARKKLLSRFAAKASVAVLDAGCHTGAFLGGLPAHWSRCGIESAIAPREVARERHAVRVIGSRLEDIGTEWNGSFDAVTMFDVIEHLPDPQAGIAAALRLLKPNGVLMLSTADLGAWTWRWLGAGHWYLQTPQHLAVLSRKFLRHVSRQCSAQLLDVVEIPHRRAPLRFRFHEAIRAVYWGMRLRRGGWRIPHRLLQSLPGLRHLRNMQSVPWTMTLNDHFLCCLARVDSGCR